MLFGPGSHYLFLFFIIDFFNERIYLCLPIMQVYLLEVLDKL